MEPQRCQQQDSKQCQLLPDDADQQTQAQASLTAAATELGRSRAALKVQIKPLKRFWPAEGYHQNYADRNSVKYTYYRWACGRDRRLDAVWGQRARSSTAWVPGRKS